MDVDDDDQVVPPIEESDETPRAPNVFIPGVHTLGKDEILEADESVYVMRHTMSANWPCLSFDILRDDEGDQRQRFPASAYIVAGTQADAAKNNKLTVFKMTQLHKTQKDRGEHRPPHRTPLLVGGWPQSSHSQRAMMMTMAMTMMTTGAITTWTRTPSSNTVPSHTLAV
jgi:Histone-binding protein RBBP4 or subunit C of CAF1 complex